MMPGARGGATKLRHQAYYELAGREPRPDWLINVLVMALLCYIWRLQDLFPILGALKFVPLVSLTAIGLYALDRDGRRSWRGASHPIAVCTTLILGLMVLSVPGSVYPGLSFDFIVQDFAKTFLLMMLVAVSIRSIRDVERLAVAQLIGAGLYSFFILWHFEIGVGGRLGNLVYYDANDLGMLLVCTLPIGVYFMRPGVRGVLRLMAVAVIAISLMTIVKTGSRGAFLGLVAVLLYMLFQFHSFSKAARYAALASMVLVLLAVADETYWGMMQTLLNPQEDYNWAGGADEGRMEVWKRGIGYMIQSPLLGVGASAFPVAEGTLSELAGRQEYGIGLKWSAAHNSFVQVGAELGVGGLLLFCALLTVSFLACHRIGSGLMPKVGAASGRVAPETGGVTTASAAMGQALCATLVGYLVAGFFLSQAYAVYLYVTYGIIIGLIRVTSTRGPGLERAEVQQALVRGSVLRSGAPTGGRVRAPVRGRL